MHHSPRSRFTLASCEQAGGVVAITCLLRAQSKCPLDPQWVHGRNEHRQRRPRRHEALWHLREKWQRRFLRWKGLESVLPRVFLLLRVRMVIDLRQKKAWKRFISTRSNFYCSDHLDFVRKRKHCPSGVRQPVKSTIWLAYEGGRLTIF